MPPSLSPSLLPHYPHSPPPLALPFPHHESQPETVVHQLQQSKELDREMREGKKKQQIDSREKEEVTK